jgi:hypothetical protein
MHKMEGIVEALRAWERRAPKRPGTQTGPQELES